MIQNNVWLRIWMKIYFLYHSADYLTILGFRVSAFVGVVVAFEAWSHYVTTLAFLEPAL